MTNMFRMLTPVKPCTPKSEEHKPVVQAPRKQRKPRQPRGNLAPKKLLENEPEKSESDAEEGSDAEESKSE